jgi:NitT/TauT family transport system substrate-binding protein
MLQVIAGAIGSIGLHSCALSVRSSPGIATSNLVPLTVAISPWIGITPLYIAEKKGYFREAGLNLTLRSFDDGTESFSGFIAGQFQAITPVTSEAVALAAQGADYRIVLVMDTSAGADAILARNSIASIDDFRGKEIAVPQNGVSHFFLLQVLAKSGMRERDVRILDVSAEVAAKAYAAGDVEIACTYSPFLENANRSQTDGRIIYDSSRLPTAIADVYAFDRQFIEQNPDAVAGFVSSVLKGLEFLKQNPEEGVAIAAQALQLSQKELAEQLKGIHLPDAQANVELLGNSQSDLYLLKSMTALAEFLQTQNQIQSIPDLTRIIDAQFVRRFVR